MSSTNLYVHPVYGSIYKDGEFIQRGAVLGLSADAKAVVVAPVSGWVRVPSVVSEVPENSVEPGLRVEIVQADGREVFSR